MACQTGADAALKMKTPVVENRGFVASEGFEPPNAELERQCVEPGLRLSKRISIQHADFNTVFGG